MGILYGSIGRCGKRVGVLAGGAGRFTYQGGRGGGKPVSAGVGRVSFGAAG